MRATLALLLVGLGFAQADDHFEKHVRPVLVEHCFKCHNDKKQGGSLRLDGLEHLTKPGDGGTPLVVAGKPDESRLLKAVMHAEGVSAMPEGGDKLSQTNIDHLKTWIKNGAAWPKATAASTKKHWAYQVPVKPEIPAIKDESWPQTDIDKFILAKLEAKKLKPSTAADKRTLLRRLTFDLTGLPPTAEELAAFEKDTSANAAATVVDRLLNSPAFGERWGRHWLDVARYADSSGAPVVDEDVRYPFAYTYRDWVVKALNSDKPYDQFLKFQIAADKLTARDDDPDLAALGFLTLGRKFENNMPEIIDDRLDTIFRGTQALSISCARCHDHKYDPIPIRDYYSLYGVFQETTEKHTPLIATPADRAKVQLFSTELRARVRSFEKHKAKERAKFGALGWSEPAKYLLAAHSKAEVKIGDNRIREDGLDQQVVDKVRDLLGGLSEYHHTVMAPWHEFSKLKPEQYAKEGKTLAAKFAANADGDKSINALVANLFTGKPPKDLHDVAQRYGKLLGLVARKWTRSVMEADRRDIARPELMEDEAEDEIRKLFFSEFPNFELTEEDLMNRLQNTARETFDKLKKEIGDWNTGPDAPAHARVLMDPDEPATPHVFIRGKPDNHGDEVPRQFLGILSGEKREPFSDGTGRLELANAIANAKNPLTARVWVNRVWAHLLGRAIITTTSDFGARGSAASHPELLDYLAVQFMEDGWSTKKLIRSIVLSRAYQQSSTPTSDFTLPTSVDVENILLWRMNRKRRSWEPYRDAMLSVGGTLDRNIGGRADTAHETSARRTLYLNVDRGNLPSAYRTFDFANPDMSSPGRHETTVPQQSLFLLNNPAVLAQAKALAGRSTISDDKAWIDATVATALCRKPTTQEVERVEAFLKAAAQLKDVGAKPAPSPWQYGYGSWNIEKKTLTKFTRFSVFQDDNWRPSTEFPDSKTYGYLTLSAWGGIPGGTMDMCAVRRWIAPQDGAVTIHGKLKHDRGKDTKPEESDGLRGYVCSSRHGLKKSVDVNNTEADTDCTVEVKAGDTIDFIADPKTGNSYDGFEWTVNLTLKLTNGREVGFDSVEDFRGPPPRPAKPLTPREKFAQVLLMSAEFAFVD
jgi:Protein of unknown function (DUF1549)/Protein of unknown function (DUF1553)/Planctomycete cytochrome C